MRYKGLDKWYFGIGIRPRYEMWTGVSMIFYCFKLKRRPPEGTPVDVSLFKDGVHGRGIFIERHFPIPDWTIEL